MEWSSTVTMYIAHSVIVVGMVMLALFVLLTVLEEDDHGETFARVIAVMVGFLIYFGARALVVSVPELMLSSIANIRPITFYPIVVALPSAAGVLVAWFILRSLKRNQVRAKRAMVFVTTFILVLFADIYAMVFRVAGATTVWHD